MGFGDSLAGWFQWLDPWGVGWLRFAMALPQNVLVTGGAGFIGSHLVERLLVEGCVVTVVDDCSTGAVDNLANVVGRPKLTVVESAVSAWDGLQNQVADSDFVFHLAAAVGVDLVVQRPVHTLQTNVRETEALLAAAAHAGTPVLLTSTSEVYGDPQIHPQTEEYWGNVNPIGIRGVYDEAKRFAESMTMAYNRLHGIDTRIVRIFNTYGERMRRDDGRAIPNFITQALAGDELTLHGDGTQTRSIGHVSDLVAGISKLMESSVSTPVNIGNPAELTMAQLAEKIIALTGSSSSIVHHPLPADDPKIRLPDITKARQMLGWEPVVAPDTGLTRTIEWFRSNSE